MGSWCPLAHSESWSPHRQWLTGAGVQNSPSRWDSSELHSRSRALRWSDGEYSSSHVLVRLLSFPWSLHSLPGFSRRHLIHRKSLILNCSFQGLLLGNTTRKTQPDFTVGIGLDLGGWPGNTQPLNVWVIPNSWGTLAEPWPGAQKSRGCKSRTVPTSGLLHPRLCPWGNNEHHTDTYFPSDGWFYCNLNRLFPKHLSISIMVSRPESWNCARLLAIFMAPPLPSYIKYFKIKIETGT